MLHNKQIDLICLRKSNGCIDKQILLFDSLWHQDIYLFLAIFLQKFTQGTCAYLLFQ